MKEKGIEKLNDVRCLAKFKVTGTNEEGFPEINHKTFVDMLVFETIVDQKNYIKFGKEWYEILDEIQAYIDHQLALLTVSNNLLPQWDLNTHRLEADYNQYVADIYGWGCLDQDFVNVAGRSKIEFCDLYDPVKQHFYHVKKTWGCKSSYLNTQAATAAESYLQSKAFKDKCAEKWPQFFHDEVKGGTIVIAIAAEKEKLTNFPKNMTYFAKLNLYNAVALIKQNDFNVVLAPVELTSA